MANVVLIGGNGFIGQHLQHALLGQQHRISVIGRRLPQEQKPNITYVEDESLRTPYSASLLSNADIVFYLATTTTPSSSVHRPTLEVETSLMHFTQLLTLLQDRSNVRVIFLSSGGTVYGESLTHPHSEHSPLCPHSYHGAMKASAELFLHSTCLQTCITGVALRASNVYGPGQYSKHKFGVIPALLSAAKHNSTFTIFGDGSESRDYLFIDDLVALCNKAAFTSLGERFTVLNAAKGQSTSLTQLIAYVESITKCKLSIQYEAPQPYQIRHVHLANDCATRVLNWSPSTSIEVGINSTWNWFRETH